MDHPSLQAWQSKVVSGDRVLMRGGLALVQSRLPKQDARVLILGGSHSAFTVANTLLDQLTSVRFADGGVTIVARREPRLFYASRQEAQLDRYEFTEQDVCPFTMRVNRLGGLRFADKELWRKLRGRAPADDRVRLLITNLDHSTALFEKAHLIIVALGYRLNTLPIFRSGQQVPVTQGRHMVDHRCRLLAKDGTAIPHVYASGLGSGFMPGGKLGGEPSFDGQQNSLWLYQHGIGEIVYEECNAHALEAA